MTDSKSISIFRTNKIPTTHISQNHLDALNTAILNFCELHKEYKWYYIADNNRRIESSKIVVHINKHEPRTISYIIEAEAAGRQLLISIDNGITVNLKNGSYDLYGLYALINDTIDTIKVPSGVVFLRRYWLLNSFLAGWFIPILLFLVFRNTTGAILWLLGFPFGIFMLAGAILNEKDNFLEKLEWEDVVLSTKIQYKTYHVKVGSPILSVLSSTKTMISIAASLATILSFLFYLAQR